MAIDSDAGFRVISTRRGSLDPPQDRELRGNSVRRPDSEPVKPKLPPQL
jgi:hypothetical protein